MTEEANNRQFQEVSEMLQFNGFVIDLFTTESGSLGMTISTVEQGYPTNENARSVDVFVKRDTLEVTSI